MPPTVAHLLVLALLPVLGLPWSPPGDMPRDRLPLTRTGLGATTDPATPVWPLDPRPELVAGFDPPVEDWGAGHRGVDLAGTPGQLVRAAADGSVTFAGRLAGRGVVVVSHGSTRTTYEPVTATVGRGQRVRAGQRLGLLETFGSHCAPRSCLHWGLLEGETYLNPLTLVGAGPVRLLPLYSGLPLARAPGPVMFGQLVPAVGDAATPWARFVRPGGVLGGTPDAIDQW